MDVLTWDDFQGGGSEFSLSIRFTLGPQDVIVCGEPHNFFSASGTNLVHCCFLCIDAAQHRRCFSSISGYCRKKCKLGETYEIACVNGKLCCINEDEKRQYQQAIEPPAPSRKPDLELDYAILPTVTLSTISL